MCSLSRAEGEPELIKEALMEAGSSSMEEFLVHFNVDILSPGVIHADEEVRGLSG